MVIIRFLTGHLISSEALAVKGVTLVCLRSDSGQTLNKQSDLEHNICTT